MGYLLEIFEPDEDYTIQDFHEDADEDDEGAHFIGVPGYDICEECFRELGECTCEMEEE